MYDGQSRVPGFQLSKEGHVRIQLSLLQRFIFQILDFIKGIKKDTVESRLYDPFFDNLQKDLFIVFRENITLKTIIFLIKDFVSI